MSSLLDDMTNLSAMAEFPNPAYVTKQFSSYDRASTAAAKKETWFANGDCGRYLRVEDRDGRKEHVMADMQGPGADRPHLVGQSRRHAPHLHRRRREARDRSSRMTDLLSGKHPLLPVPIGAGLSQGWNLYLPMPYAKSCKVTCDKGGQYYHVNYRTYPAGTAVTSFTLRATQGSPSRPRRNSPSGWLRRALRRRLPGRRLLPRPLTPRWPPARASSLPRQSGPRAVVRFRARVKSPEDQIEAALRAVVVRMTFDGEQTVEAPLGDFFGAAPGVNPFASLPLGVEKDGWMYCHWVMPFEKSAEITLANLGKSPVSVEGLLSAAPWNGPTPRCTSTPGGGPSSTCHAADAGLELPRPRRARACSAAWPSASTTQSRTGGAKAMRRSTSTARHSPAISAPARKTTTATPGAARSDSPTPTTTSRAATGRATTAGPVVNRFHILDRIPFTKNFKFDMETLALEGLQGDTWPCWPTTMACPARRHVPADHGRAARHPAGARDAGLSRSPARSRARR